MIPVPAAGRGIRGGTDEGQGKSGEAGSVCPGGDHDLRAYENVGGSPEPGAETVPVPDLRGTCVNMLLKGIKTMDEQLKTDSDRL